MAVTFVCPSCRARWKIVDKPETMDMPVKCPNCLSKEPKE